MSTHRVLWLVVVFGVAAVRAAEPDPELVQAEKTLHDAKIDTTGPGLMRFLRDHVLTDADRARLPDAVKRLGDDDFEVREKAVEELLRAGQKALPYLRPALRDKDPERARRVAQCVEQILSGADWSRLSAAARLLADRKPEGAAAALLAYLPAADHEPTEQAVLRALLVVGVKEAKPDAALLKALTDKEPLCRAAAAYVLGRALPKQRDAVRKLLADPEPRVRAEAAEALVRAGDKNAVPVLIALLEKGPMQLGWRAQELLYCLAGEKAPKLALIDEAAEKRAAVAGALRGWWRDAAPTADLTEIDLDETFQGITVICEYEKNNSSGRVWACRTDGKVIWEIKGINGPADVQLLPGGRVLICEHLGKKITERDLSGKILWTKEVAHYPTTCRRLANGNTFIATHGEIMEVDPKGTPLYSYKNVLSGNIFRARKLRNGNILYISAGDSLVELDPAGKEVRRVKLPAATGGWGSVEPLPGDHFLLSMHTAGKAMEIDNAGKVVWQFDTRGPTSAERLPNGNILVTSWDIFTVIEYDRTGKEIWKLTREGGIMCARRF